MRKLGHFQCSLSLYPPPPLSLSLFLSLSLPLSLHLSLPYSSLTPEHWASLTDTNIDKAEEQCKASATLRGVIDSVLNQSSQDIETQRGKVDLAFQKRVRELADAKQTLEQHLAKVTYAAGARVQLGNPAARVKSDYRAAAHL